MQKRLITLLAGGHLFTDISQGVLPALLPFFIATHRFSYTAAAGLVFVANLVSSFTQPVFGHLADRYSVPWFVPTGIMAAGVGVALTAIAPTYWSMLLAIALSGLGVAAFHPEATRLVNFFSGSRKATAMSMFAVGGNVGFAVGPLAATACVVWLGLRGALLLVVPGLLASAVLLAHRSQMSSMIPAAPGGSRHHSELRDHWGPFAYLTATVVFRSVVFFGLNTFLSLYWIGYLHQSKSAGNTALSILLFSGAAGTLLGGPLADAYGRSRVVLGSLLVVPVLLATLLMAHKIVLATALLVPLGLVLFANFSVMVVMAQDFLPNHLGVASGVTFGLASSVGGMATPLFGRIADRHGIHASLSALMLVSCVAALLAMVLHRSDRIRRVS